MSRDYFLADPGRFADIPRGVLAHSTHVRGLGTMEGGIERPRIKVILASAIPPETCARINLGYLDPQAIDPERLPQPGGRGHPLCRKGRRDPPSPAEPHP